jgi:hypothetical protein
MMCATMASRAERDQVFLRISTQVASEFLVVYFQVRHSAAGLASPAIATQHLLPEPLIRSQIQSQA